MFVCVIELAVVKQYWSVCNVVLCCVWSWSDQHQKGNIFTLFLHSPLMAFCHIVNIIDVPVSLWDKCLSVVDKFIADASRLLSRSRTLGKSQHALCHHSILTIYPTLILRLLLKTLIF